MSLTVGNFGPKQMLGLRACWSQKAITSTNRCWLAHVLPLIQLLISCRTCVGSDLSEISAPKLEACSSACWLPLHCQNFSSPNLMLCSSWVRCALVQETMTCLPCRKNRMLSHKLWLEEEGLVLAWDCLWQRLATALASMAILTVPVICWRSCSKALASARGTDWAYLTVPPHPTCCLQLEKALCLSWQRRPTPRVFVLGLDYGVLLNHQSQTPSWLHQPCGNPFKCDFHATRKKLVKYI